MSGQPSFLVQDYWDLLARGAAPSALVGDCASCFFYSLGNGEILLADNSNGPPEDVGFFGGIVESGNQIFIRNCQFQNNGTLSSGTTAADYYDLNWSASGLVRGCTFNTEIKPEGTSGVAATSTPMPRPVARSPSTGLVSVSRRERSCPAGSTLRLSYAKAPTWTVCGH